MVGVSELSKKKLEEERKSGLNVMRCAKVNKKTMKSRAVYWLAKRIVFDMLKQNFKSEYFRVSMHNYSSCIILYYESLKDLQKSIEDLKNQPEKQNEKLSILSEDPVFIEFKDLHERVYGKELSNITALQKKIMYINSYLALLNSKHALCLDSLEDQNHKLTPALN